MDQRAGGLSTRVCAAHRSRTARAVSWALGRRLRRDSGPTSTTPASGLGVTNSASVPHPRRYSSMPIARARATAFAFKTTSGADAGRAGRVDEAWRVSSTWIFEASVLTLCAGTSATGPCGAGRTTPCQRPRAKPDPAATQASGAWEPLVRSALGDRSGERYVAGQRGRGAAPGTPKRDGTRGAAEGHSAPA